MRTHFEDQTSPQSNSGGGGGTNGEDCDYDCSVGQPVDWTVVRGHVGKFTRAGPSTASAYGHVEDNQVDDAASQGRRRPQYGVLHATPLGRMPYIMHQHIDSALITAFVERWQPDTNTFHLLWGR